MGIIYRWVSISSDAGALEHPLSDPPSLCFLTLCSLNHHFGSIPACTRARRPGCSLFPSTPHSSMCFLLSAWLFTDLPFFPHQAKWLLINSSGLLPPTCVCYSGSPAVPLLPSPPHLRCYLHRNLPVNPQSSFSSSSICLTVSLSPSIPHSSSLLFKQWKKRTDEEKQPHFKGRYSQRGTTFQTELKLENQTGSNFIVKHLNSASASKV